MQVEPSDRYYRIAWGSTTVWSLLCAMALTSLAQALDALPPTEAARLHAQAIENARGGNFIPALRTLERLRAQDPANRRYVYDYVLVLTWAEKDQAALDLAPLVDRAAAPIEVVEALAKAARNRRRFGRSPIMLCSPRAPPISTLSSPRRRFRSLNRYSNTIRRTSMPGWRSFIPTLNWMISPRRLQ